VLSFMVYRFGAISVTMYNFGSPRVGNKRFVEVYNEVRLELFALSYNQNFVYVCVCSHVCACVYVAYILRILDEWNSSVFSSQIT